MFLMVIMMLLMMFIPLLMMVILTQTLLAAVLTVMTLLAVMRRTQLCGRLVKTDKDIMKRMTAIPHNKHQTQTHCGQVHTDLYLSRLTVVSRAAQ